MTIQCKGVISDMLSFNLGVRKRSRMNLLILVALFCISSAGVLDAQSSEGSGFSEFGFGEKRLPNPTSEAVKLYCSELVNSRDTQTCFHVVRSGSHLIRVTMIYVDGNMAEPEISETQMCRGESAVGFRCDHRVSIRGTRLRVQGSDTYFSLRNLPQTKIAAYFGR